MKAPATPRVLVPALAAAAGVVVAHAVDYIVLFPRSGSRDAYLHATGHGYWPVAVTTATAAAALAVLLVAASAARQAARGAPAVSGRGRVVVATLLAWQIGAFVVLESGERSLAGIPATALVHSPEFWLGLLLQVPVAWLVVRLLGRVERTATAFGARLRRPRLRARRPVLMPSVVAAPARAPLGSRARPRGPPAFSFR